MKLKSLTPILTAALIAIGAAVTLQQPSQALTTFECLVPTTGPYAGMPATYANTAGGYRAVIRWNSRYFAGAGYNPRERCQEVTERFNRLNARPGGIDIITTGYLNGLPVVYSPSHGGERASSDNLLFTLKKGENAAQKVQQLFDLRAGAAGAGPLFESSADGDSITIDFNKFLSNAPVESGISGSSSPPAVPGTPDQPSQQPSGGSGW